MVEATMKLYNTVDSSFTSHSCASIKAALTYRDACQSAQESEPVLSHVYGSLQLDILLLRTISRCTVGSHNILKLYKGDFMVAFSLVFTS
jgi:hypothetical protein